MRRRMSVHRSGDDTAEEDGWRIVTHCQDECLILVWQTISKRREEKEERGGSQIKRGSKSWWGIHSVSRRASAQVFGGLACCQPSQSRRADSFVVGFCCGGLFRTFRALVPLELLWARMSLIGQRKYLDLTRDPTKIFREAKERWREGEGEHQNEQESGRMTLIGRLIRREAHAMATQYFF